MSARDLSKIDAAAGAGEDGPLVVVLMSDCMLAVEAVFGVRKLDLVSHRRTADIVTPRHVVFYLAKSLTPLSFPEIGRRMGGRDHTTVISALRKFGARLQRDPEFGARVMQARDYAQGLAEARGESPEVVEALRQMRIQEAQAHARKILGLRAPPPTPRAPAKVIARAPTEEDIEQEARETISALAAERRPQPRERLVAALCELPGARFSALRQAEDYRRRMVFTGAEAAASRGVAREIARLAGALGEAKLSAERGKTPRGEAKAARGEVRE